MLSDKDTRESAGFLKVFVGFCFHSRCWISAAQNSKLKFIKKFYPTHRHVNFTELPSGTWWTQDGVGRKVETLNYPIHTPKKEFTHANTHNHIRWSVFRYKIWRNHHVEMSNLCVGNAIILLFFGAAATACHKVRKFSNEITCDFMGSVLICEK